MSGGLFVNALLREIGQRLPRQSAERLLRLHDEAYARQVSQVRLLPGAVELLEALRGSQLDAKSWLRHVRIWRAGTEMQAAVFEMLTFDYAGGALGNLEMSIEISRWGDSAKEDARYPLQPYYVAANVHRFNEPAGTLTEVAP